VGDHGSAHRTAILGAKREITAPLTGQQRQERSGALSIEVFRVSADPALSIACRSEAASWRGFARPPESPRCAAWRRLNFRLTAARGMALVPRGREAIR
jgi:hypothetical protein